uniref:Protein phosphatase 1 regulatory subunit 14D n=1 Tax=Ficedula albicollis TaxID=59894 RepID=A0A803VY58_FICAL
MCCNCRVWTHYWQRGRMGKKLCSNESSHRKLGKLTIKYNRKDLQRWLDLEEWINAQLQELYQCRVSSWGKSATGLPYAFIFTNTQSCLPCLSFPLHQEQSLLNSSCPPESCPSRKAPEVPTTLEWYRFLLQLLHFFAGLETFRFQHCLAILKF